jgi:subtilase family serine protease
MNPAASISGLTLLVKLAPDQRADLENLIREQQNPSSPQFQHWLTPEEFGDRFGLSRSDESKLTAWLASEGLEVTTARGRNALEIRGSAAQVSRALGTPLHNFRVSGQTGQTGQTRFAATSEPSVPEALTDIVAGFIGLDDFPLEAHAKLAPPNLNSGTSHFLAPEDFATIYNLSPLYATGIDGTGQSIVVVGQSAVSLSDIRAFRTRYGLPANDPRMILYGGTNPGFTSSEIEGVLDLEWSGAVAPKATINYVYGTNAFTAMLFAIQQNISPVISVSYGSCETDYCQCARHHHPGGIRR